VRHFKAEPIETVVFSFGISENIVFSNVIDCYHSVDERYNSQFRIGHAKKRGMGAIPSGKKSLVGL
jgi:hypothetical protein